MIYPFFRPLLFTLDPETAHGMAFASLDVAAKLGIVQAIAPRPAAFARSRAMGPEFPNRVGLAAGLDKNAAHIDGLSRRSVSDSSNAGRSRPARNPATRRPASSVCPRPKPLVNRLGFNNGGVERFLANVGARRGAASSASTSARISTRRMPAPSRRLSRLPARVVRPCVVRHGQHLVAEHERAARPAIRGALSGLIGALKAEQKTLPTGTENTRRSPSKIAPRLEAAGDRGHRAVSSSGTRVDARHRDEHDDRGTRRCEATAARRRNGRPVRPSRSRPARRRWSQRSPRRSTGALPIIGVGGILSGADAKEKDRRRRNADPQIYTGLIYRGPDLVAECARARWRRLRPLHGHVGRARSVAHACRR